MIGEYEMMMTIIMIIMMICDERRTSFVSLGHSTQHHDSRSSFLFTSPWLWFKLLLLFLNLLLLLHPHHDYSTGRWCYPRGGRAPWATWWGYHQHVYFFSSSLQVMLGEIICVQWLESWLTLNSWCEESLFFCSFLMLLFLSDAVSEDQE